MFKKAILFFCCLVPALQTFADSLLLSQNKDKCDTIITIEGKRYVADISRETETEVLFTLCDDLTGATYAVPNKRILEIRRHTGRIDKMPQPETPKPPYEDPGLPLPAETTSKYKEPDTDTICSNLILSDGRSLQVRIIEEDKFNYFYMICGSTDGLVYMAPIKQSRLVNSGKRKFKGLNGCLSVILLVTGLVYLVSLIAQMTG